MKYLRSLPKGQQITNHCQRHIHYTFKKINIFSCNVLHSSFLHQQNTKHITRKNGGHLWLNVTTRSVHMSNYVISWFQCIGYWVDGYAAVPCLFAAGKLSLVQCCTLQYSTITKNSYSTKAMKQNHCQQDNWSRGRCHTDSKQARIYAERTILADPHPLLKNSQALLITMAAAAIWMHSFCSIAFTQHQSRMK